MMVSLGGSGNQEYVISMDDIDLGMLSPFTHQSRYETVPRCPSAEYFEFEVIDGVGGEDARPRPENRVRVVRVQRCHVCDVDVPVTYLEEHRRSDGHRAYCSITDVALERAKKQISLDNSLASVSRSSTYYCPSCSCAVETNQNDHEKSQEHSQSVLHMKLLQSLASLYQNKKNLDTVCKDLLKVVNKGGTEKGVDNDIELKDAREHKIDEISNKDVTVKQNDDINEEVPSLESPIPTNTKDESNQEDDVIIITESKSKLRVSFDNYQGFIAVRGYTQCHVCRELIDDKTQHVLDEKHKMIVEAVVKDKHCIRQLDHLYNYCILCNEVIESPEAHILCSPHHRDFLEKALIEDSVTEILNNLAEYSIKSDDSKIFFCDACGIYLKETTLLDHVKSDAHHKSLSNYKKHKQEIDSNSVYCSVCDTYVQSGTKSRIAHSASKTHKYKLWLTEKDTKIHYHMRKSAFENVVVCCICDMQLNNNIGEIKEHVNSKQHQNNREMMLKNNYMENVNDCSVFCMICNETEYVIDEIQHTKSKSHLNQLRDFTPLKIEPEELKQIKQSHENAKLKEILQINRIEIYDVSYYQCKVCFQCFKKTEVFNHMFSKKHKGTRDGCLEVQLEHRNEHLESEPHKANIQSTFKTDIINVPDNLNTNIKEEEANEPGGSVMERSTFAQLKQTKKLHYLFEESLADGRVTCLVCNINMSFDKVLAHRKDKNHHEIYAKVMDSNTMFRIKHRCFCECCREILKIDYEYIHLISERHRLNLINNNERMDKESLYKLSSNMFHKDIAAEKRAKKHAKLATTRFAHVGGDYRFENHKTCLFLSSSNDLQSDDDEEDNSVSDSNDGFMSAMSSVTSEEFPGMIPENKYTESDFSEEPEKGDDEVETAAEFTKSISYLFEETNNPVELLCKLCHCVVANRSDMILEHIIGVKHAKKYESILLVNELKETIDKRKEIIQKYRCQACGLDVEKNELFAHINGNKHKLYLTAKPSTSWHFLQTGVEKDVKVEPIRIEQVINKKSKIEVVLSSECLHKLIFKNNNGSNELYCKLCDSEFSVTDLNNHINSRTHQMAFDFYLLENEIKKIGVTFFCDLCKIGLAEGTELDHLYGDKHTENLTKYSLSTSRNINITVKPNVQISKKVNSHVCIACNVEMLNIPKIIKTHYVSVGHKTNVEKTKTGRHISKDDFTELSSLNSNGKAQSSELNSEYFCKVCNVKLPNNHKNIKIHNDGARHVSKLKESKPSVVSSLLKLTESKPTDAIPLRKLTESTPIVALPSPVTNSLPKPISSANIPTTNIAKPAILNYVENGFCHVCKTNVENKIGCIREHLKGTTHNETLNTLKLKLNENNAQIPKQSHSSQNVVSKSEINYSYVKDGFCRACKMKIPNNIGNIEEHIKGKYHIQTVNIIKSNKSANNKVCNKSVDFVAGPFQNNVLTVPSGSKGVEINENLLSIADGSATRKRSRRRKKNPNSTSQNNVGGDTGATLNNNIIMTSSDIPKVADFVLGNLEKTESTDPLTSIPPRNNNTCPNNNNNHIQPKIDSKSVYFCKICKLQVPNNQNNIQEHMKGTRHKSNVTNLIQISPPAEVEAQDVYECLICDLNVNNDTNNIAEHFKGKKHKMNVENLISGKQISVIKLPDKNQDNNSNRKEEKNINEGLIGAKTLQVDNADIKTIISQPCYYSANVSGSRIFDSNTVDVSDVKVNINRDNLSNAAVASTSKLTLDDVISMCCWLSRHSNSITSSSDKSNESGKTESINSTIPKINITECCNSDGTIGASISCTSKAEDYIEMSALKCEDTKPGIGQLYDSSKIDSTEINIKTNTGNVVDTTIANNNTLDNIILSSPTNLVSPSCDNSNESEYAKNISTKIATTNINTDVDNESSEMQIFKSTEPDTSKDIPSIPSTSKHEDINIKNITLDGTTMDTNISGSPKTEESNTDTDTARVGEADDVTSDFFTVTTKDNSYETNDDSAAKTEPHLGFYVCNVCERSVPNNQADIKSHLSSYHHSSKLSEKKLKEQEGLLSNPEEYCCIFCNEKMTNNSMNINNHDNTLGHRNRFNKVLLQNKIKMRDDKVGYCEVCDLYFSKFTVKTHIDREKHKSLLEVILNI